jgi:hypothetical protein
MRTKSPYITGFLAPCCTVLYRYKAFIDSSGDQHADESVMMLSVRSVLNADMISVVHSTCFVYSKTMSSCIFLV